MDLALFGITVDLGYVILGVLAYAVGLASVMGYNKLRVATTEKKGSSSRYSADEAVVEAVVMEYTRRLKDYDRVMAEMRAKIDITEARIGAFSQPHTAYVTAQPQQVQAHAPAVSEPVPVTQQHHHSYHQPAAAVVTAGAEGMEKFEGQNGTVDYILKLLAERPRASREVQHAIGRTREHTARLMKKLHDSGLVTREVGSKPFRYAITEAGRQRLGEKAAVVVSHHQQQEGGIRRAAA
ncbi:MAG: helix-turn-helix domain-containing protein [Thermoproteota archaeon]